MDIRALAGDVEQKHTEHISFWDDGRNRAARFSKAVGLRKVAMACHEEPLQIAKRSVLVSSDRISI